MAVEDGGGRISVSRDALRADLAEMELRLRVYFDAKLQEKASISDHNAMVVRVAELETTRAARDRGELTPALERAIDARIAQAATTSSANEWTGRERAMAVVSVATAILMLSLSVVLALHGVIL